MYRLRLDMKAHGLTAFKMATDPKRMLMEVSEIIIRSIECYHIYLFYQEVTRANGYVVCDMDTAFEHRHHLEWRHDFVPNPYELR